MEITNPTRLTSIPKLHPPLPRPPGGRRHACRAHRRGRSVDSVRVYVHVETIYVHYSRADILATDVAVRGWATSRLSCSSSDGSTAPLGAGWRVTHDDGAGRASGRRAGRGQWHRGRGGADPAAPHHG